MFSNPPSPKYSSDKGLQMFTHLNTIFPQFIACDIIYGSLQSVRQTDTGKSGTEQGRSDHTQDTPGNDTIIRGNAFDILAAHAQGKTTLTHVPTNTHIE